MLRLFLLALLLLTAQSAWADEASSFSGLALAALVAANSPTLKADEKKVMAALFDGQSNVPFPAGKKIAIAADKITCKGSNVDITQYSCELTFGRKTIDLSGRKAHEIFATLVEVGIPVDGALGTIYEGLSHLDCAIDPAEIKEKGGGGAHCQFNPGVAQ